MVVMTMVWIVDRGVGDDVDALSCYQRKIAGSNVGSAHFMRLSCIRAPMRKSWGSTGEPARLESGHLRLHFDC
jgi:hypothetical protein